MYRTLLLILLGSVIHFKIFASSCDIESVKYKLANDRLYADFVQSKSIAALSRPLISKGQIWMSPDGELVWQVLVPFKSTMVIHQGGVRQYTKDDRLKGNRNNPMVTDISKIFLALLSGNIEQINETFSNQLICAKETPENPGNAWQLVLTPKESIFESFINQISIFGNQQLQEIHFVETRGDKTEITLSQKYTQVQGQFDQYIEREIKAIQNNNERSVEK